MPSSPASPAQPEPANPAQPALTPPTSLANAVGMLWFSIASIRCAMMQAEARGQQFLKDDLAAWCPDTARYLRASFDYLGTYCDERGIDTGALERLVTPTFLTLHFTLEALADAELLLAKLERRVAAEKGSGSTSAAAPETPQEVHRPQPVQPPGDGPPPSTPTPAPAAGTVTAHEAADRLGVNVTTVTRWCQSDKVAGARKERGVWHIPSASLAGSPARPAAQRKRSLGTAVAWECANCGEEKTSRERPTTCKCSRPTYTRPSVRRPPAR